MLGIIGRYVRIPRLESRALKYGYSNARVKAMKGQLLKQAYLDELIKVKTIEGMAELLQRSPYKADLAGAGMSYSGSALIETAGARNFASTVRKLIKIAPKSDKAAVTALLVRWDLINIKVLLNARRLKKTYEEVKPVLYPVGGLREEDFKRIVSADDADLLRQIRRTELGQKIMPPGKIAIENLEGTLDTSVYMMLDKELSAGGKEAAAIREILKKEIDAKNIMIIERMKRHGASQAKITAALIKGGTLRDNTISRLMEAKDMAAVLNIVRTKFRRFDFKGEKMTELEIALEKAIAADKVGAFAGAMLSAGVIFGFLLLKEEEINNLRKIAKGKQFNMSEGEVRSMLVY